MSPAPAITIADGEITVDAEMLAPKLGLSVEALKAEMRKGNVSSVAEAGIDDDAGRTRVTFKYRTRVWTGVLNPDGTWVDRLSFMLVESLARAQRLPITYQEAAKGLLLTTATAWDCAATTAVEDGAPETLALPLRAHLQTFSTQRLPITYPDAAKGLLLTTPPSTIHQVTEALEQLMADPKPNIT